MPRGRTPSNSDENAIMAVAEVRAFLQEMALSPTALAAQLNVSASAVLRALSSNPPAWTPTLKKLNNFINSRRPATHAGANVLELQLRGLRGAGSARATAAVLRAVADLLDQEAVAG